MACNEVAVRRQMHNVMSEMRAKMEKVLDDCANKTVGFGGGKSSKPQPYPDWGSSPRQPRKKKKAAPKKKKPGTYRRYRAQKTHKRPYRPKSKYANKSYINKKGERVNGPLYAHYRKCRATFKKANCMEADYSYLGQRRRQNPNPKFKNTQPDGCYWWKGRGCYKGNTVRTPDWYFINGMVYKYRLGTKLQVKRAQRREGEDESDWQIRLASTLSAYKTPGGLVADDIVIVEDKWGNIRYKSEIQQKQGVPALSNAMGCLAGQKNDWAQCVMKAREQLGIEEGEGPAGSFVPLYKSVDPKRVDPWGNPIPQAQQQRGVDLLRLTRKLWAEKKEQLRSKC